jgi:hypothetical protein
MNKVLLFLLVVFIALVAARHIEENKYLEDEYENTLANTDDLEEPELEEVPAEEAYITAGRTGGSSSRTGGSTSRTGGSSTSRTGGTSTSRTGGSSTSRTGGSSTSRTGGSSTSRTGGSSTSRTGGTGITIGGTNYVGSRTTYVSKPKVIRFAGQYTFENFEPAGTPLPAGYRSMTYI